ncbi:hypothetical protein AMK68_05195 [candidate division KD3-62 bacterium DG_56]|uniref:DUF4190 domain-containing protein n=1 Tax=candidate division KD3-62 bacterium DG_56 TaxID=1704032 RepID=A0A0S7XIB7_9BACT|nr:MAG: hypothetical protein AMK68_05195 [candidate division KD3-62 bacterium DG_56]
MTPPSAPLTPHRATTILVLGILGILCCAIVGIVAWVMGNNDLREMEAGRMDPAGRDMTNIGRILGMVAVGLWILWIILAFGFNIALFPFMQRGMG